MTTAATGIIYLHYPFYEKWSQTLVGFDPYSRRTSLVKIPDYRNFDLQQTRIAQLGLDLFAFKEGPVVNVLKMSNLGTEKSTATEMKPLGREAKWYALATHAMRYIYLSGGQW